MRQNTVGLTEFFAQREIRFLRLPITRDDAESPVCDFVSVTEPFIGPSKKYCASKSAPRHALQMPGKQLGLFLLRMPNGVHAKLTEDERAVFGKVLQPEQITLELALMVEINVEAAEIDVLRQKIFGGWISGVGKKNVGIESAADPHQRFDKLRHAARTQPADHRAWNFVGHQIPKNCGVARIALHVPPHLRFDDATRGASAKVHILPPPEGDHHADAVFETKIQEPARWGIIDSHNVDSEFAHHAQIQSGLLRGSDVEALPIRREGPISDSFQKKLSITLKKEFRDRANSRVCCPYHVKRSLRLLRDQSFLGLRVRDSSTSPGMTNYKCCGRWKISFPGKRTVFPTPFPALRASLR